MYDLPVIFAVAIVKTMELICLLSWIYVIYNPGFKFQRVLMFALMVIPLSVINEIATRYYYAYRVVIYMVLETMILMLLLKMFYKIKFKQSFIAIQIFYIMVCGGKIISNWLVPRLFGFTLTPVINTLTHILQYIIVYCIVGLLVFLVRYSKLLTGYPKDIRNRALVSGGVFIGFTLIMAYINGFYYDDILNIKFGGMVIILDISLFLYLLYNLIVTNKNYIINKQLIDTLNKKNMELETANRQLKVHAATVGELTAERERTRIARETHDALGRVMTLIVISLEVCIIKYENNSADLKDSLINTLEIAREGINELKRSLSGITSPPIEPDNPLKSLQHLIALYELADITIDLSVLGELNQSNPIYFETVYQICRETLTNALRHGGAKRVFIELDITPEKMRLDIMDNGVGNRNFKKGFGLAAIEQAVYDLNGKISFHSAEQGFSIKAEIPLKEEEPVEDRRYYCNRKQVFLDE